MTNTLKRNVKLFLTSNGLTTIASSLHHSVLTVLLLSRGLNISNIVFVQLFFNISIVLFEFPSGVIADLFSRKQLYIISNILLCVFFLIVLFTGNILYLSIAWVFYGLANALGSGTLDAQIVNDIKMENESLSNFFRKAQQINIISLLFGSTVGSILFFIIGDKIYVISVVLCLTSIYIIKYFVNTQKIDKNNRPTLSQHLKQTFTEIKKSKEIQLLTACTIVSQIFLQTHFQLWQNYLLSFNVDKKIFFMFYIIFQLISFFVIFISFDYLEKMKKYIYFLPIILILAVLFLDKNLKIGLLSYFVTIGFYTIINYYINVKFSKIISLNNISSITSFRSTISRLAAIITLATTSYMLKYFLTGTVIIINFTFSLVFISVLLYMLNNLILKTNENFK